MFDCFLFVVSKSIVHVVPAPQNAATEDKQVQYIFRALGTPKMVGYTEDYEKLPLAPLYGRNLVVSCDGQCKYSMLFHNDFFIVVQLTTLFQ